MYKSIREDKIIYKALKKERIRQEEHLELIASENYCSKAVRKAQGSILTNKYAEGYPGQRYYGGCEYVDIIEQEAQNRLKELFNVKFANVQPHSGSQANAAVYHALLEPNDIILGMDLASGGHLTHGYKLSFSGKFYKTYSYGVNKETQLLDYEEILKIAKEVKPKIIVCGASAYTREINFKEFRKIADEVGAYLMADIAHIAGLIATNNHMSPVLYADVITSTTHKTLRGPRGGVILTNNPDIAKKVNKAVFPGQQGGPLMHVIAAKAISFKEALEPEYKEYVDQVCKNAKTLANEFKNKGYKLVSNGTDNHMILINVKDKFNITGLEAETILHSVNITCNKNSIPFDEEKPKYTSGIRLGTPALTTRGFKEKDMVVVCNLIDQALSNRDDKEVLKYVKDQVLKLVKQFKL